MLNKLHQGFHLLKYNTSAVNAHGIHSPFVFELYNTVFTNDAVYYAYKEIEALREELLANEKTISVTDLGAGSHSGLKKQRKIKDIAYVSAKNKKHSQLLFRLVNYFQPQVILELGTSLGISTSYLAMANSNAKVLTIEGCAETEKIAKETFGKLGIKNISSKVGNFDNELPKIIEQENKLDFVFFDGNHRKEATLNYFHQCLEKITNESVFIFDDIYWSPEMTEAWNMIKANERVTVTLDLFQMGIVFFRKEQTKQHFTLKY